MLEAKFTIDGLDGCGIGFEFEFLRDDSYSITKIARDIRLLCKVKVRKCHEAHSEFIPCDKVWKLEPDFSGGSNLVELVTGVLPYKDAKIYLKLILNYIKSNDNLSVNSKCGLHINVNCDDYSIKRLDVLKFILDFDEDVVYKHFPKRRENLYCKSITDLRPIKPIYNMDKFNDLRYVHNFSKLFNYPSTKYYGVNFKKLSKDYLEFRYIGGEEYVDKVDAVLELMDYFLNTLKKSYKESYSQKHLDKLKKIIRSKNLLFESTLSYEHFRKIFTHLKLSVDGNHSKEIVKSFFTKMINSIYPIFLSSNGLKYLMRGTINYDSDNGVLEFYECNMNDMYINEFNIRLIHCVVEKSFISNASLYECKCKNVDLDGSDTYDCTFNKSRLKNGLHKETIINNSYISGKTIVLQDCEIKGDTIFREGIYRDCEIGNKVEVIDAIDKNLEEEEELKKIKKLNEY